MAREAAEEAFPTDRESPVGEPVIRGDASITGERAREAVRFDPDDPVSVEQAVETVRSFATQTDVTTDNIYMLRGAAACAALVRAEGSYKGASERAGPDVPVTFIRKWARVHDLPRAIRIQVARGTIAPTAAKHIARVSGDARYQLAWATIDNELTVREVRSIASAIRNGDTVDQAFANHDIVPGRFRIQLPLEVHQAVWREASLTNKHPEDIITDTLRSLSTNDSVTSGDSRH